MASLRISFSIVLRPSRRSRSRTRFSSSRTREVPTTSSSACTAACPPSIMRRFQANNCEGAMPARRATKDTLMPGCMASSTSRTFSAADHRRRRCTEVMNFKPGNRAIGGRRHSRNHRPTPMPYQLCRVSGRKRGAVHPTIDRGQVVVRELAPLFFDLALNLFPISFNPIPIHACSLRNNVSRGNGLLSPVVPSLGRASLLLYILPMLRLAQPL